MNTVASVEKLKCFCSDDAMVEIRSEERKIEIQGKQHIIEKQYYHCTECGEEWVTPVQSKASTDQIIALKRRAQGVLAPEDIRNIREKHGLTLEQAAALFGSRAETFEKFERGEVYPSLVMDKIIRVFDSIPEAKALLSRYISQQEK